MALNLRKAKESAPQDGEFQPLTEGRYTFTVEEGRPVTANTGTPMLEFQFRCEGPQFQNRKLWHRFALTENAQIFIVRFLEALGKDDITNQENVTEQQVIAAATGGKVSAYVSITSRNGKSYNNLSNFSKVDEDDADGTSFPPAGSSGTVGDSPQPAANKSALFG